MQLFYNNYESLSLGIIIGPIMFLIGLFFRKKKKNISRLLFVLGIIYFSIAVLLIYRFIQEEKTIVQQRERAKNAE